MSDMWDDTIRVCSSDWHLTARRPKFRKDNYTEAQLKKVEFILQTCKDFNAELIIAGDIFDTAREPRWLVSEVIKLFKKYEIVGKACAGQHDQIYHSRNLADTSLNLLFVSGILEKVGFDWGEEIKSGTGILVTHRCVTEKVIPFIDYSITAKKFLKTYSTYSLVVTGDYHKYHYLTTGTQTLVNPGTISRNKSDMVRYKPKVIVTQGIDILHEIEIPVDDDVFNMEAIERYKTREELNDELTTKFDTYIEGVKKQKLKPDFKKVLSTVVADINPSDKVKEEIGEIVK